MEHEGLVVIYCPGEVGQGWKPRERSPGPVAGESCWCRVKQDPDPPIDCHCLVGLIWSCCGWWDIMFDLASLLMLLQNMLLEIEEKVLALSELSMHSENLLLEGRTEMREDAEQLATKLHTLKGGLLELQRMLQDKQIHIQVRWQNTTKIFSHWHDSSVLFSIWPSMLEIHMLNSYVFQMKACSKMFFLLTATSGFTAGTGGQWIRFQSLTESQCAGLAGTGPDYTFPTTPRQSTETKGTFRSIFTIVSVLSLCSTLERLRHWTLIQCICPTTATDYYFRM